MSTVLEKRKALFDFCHGRDYGALCNGCPLWTFHCGLGPSFFTTQDGNYMMSDEEIIEAYDIVFPNTSDERNHSSMITAVVPRPSLSPDAPVIENENGGRQSSTSYAFHLLPIDAIFAAAEVAKSGADKYGETFGNRNYTKIPVEDHINHCIQHLYGYLAGDTSDDHLAHAIVRAMFAYDVAMRKCKEPTHENTGM